MGRIAGYRSKSHSLGTTRRRTWDLRSVRRTRALLDGPYSVHYDGHAHYLRLVLLQQPERTLDHGSSRDHDAYQTSNPVGPNAISRKKEGRRLPLLDHLCFVFRSVSDSNQVARFNSRSVLEAYPS